jgi:hypothetical protein
MIFFLLTYLLKLSITLLVLYVFYRVVLRPLTFYQWNRFYLLSYSMLAFILPFIDISSWIGRQGMQKHQLIKIVPALNDYTKLPLIGTNSGPLTKTVSESLTTIDVVALLFVAGFLFMLFRLCLQYVSLWRIRRKAVLLTSGDEVKVFETTAESNPFSFGRSIYINRNRHTEEELQRMVAHEMVHVKQKHTIDLLIGEFLCIVNWFNPFAWLIRHAIRQNLEFIADNQVVALQGVNKKEYQYLLLKVAGAPAYRIAHHFNFSHLKKRIAMMNKLKSTKAHLLKFLFVLPLLLLLLVAFRKEQQQAERVVWLAGLVVDADNMQPIDGAKIYCKEKNVSAVTDIRGYYEMKIPYENRPLHFVLLVSKEGYGTVKQTENWGNFYEEHIRKKYQYSVELFGLQKGGGSGFSTLAGNVSEKAELNYEYAISQLAVLKEAIENDNEPPAAVAPVLPEPKNLPNHIKNISITHNIDIKKKINIQVATVTLTSGKTERYDLTNPQEKVAFDEKYGEYNPPTPPLPPAGPSVAIVTAPSSPVVAATPPSPAAAPSPEAFAEVSSVPEVAAAFPGKMEINVPINPSSSVKREWPSNLKKININYNKVELVFENGSKEYYDFDKPNEKKAYEKKYGKMPVPPPPPPPAEAPSSPKAPKSPDHSMINSKGYKITVADDNGECVVIVKNPDSKIVKAMLLTEWGAREKYYSNVYGEIPPPSPSAKYIPQNQ